MAKRKGKSGSGEAQYSKTQANLDRKGKTNKKVKRNPMASKYLTATGKEIIAKAAEFAKEHPAYSGHRYNKKETVAE